MRVLVTGGVRSGKSAHAEGLLHDRPAVTYLAPGPEPDAADPEWAARVVAHRARRPAHWSTVETVQVAVALDRPGCYLLDCLGTWTTAHLDELDAWTGSGWEPEFEQRLQGLTAAVGACDDIVVVSNEVGLGLVPAHASGRLFGDVLGTVNQRVAAVCDEVHLVVAGRVLVL